MRTYRRRSIEERFFRKVTPGYPDKCWEWTGQRTKFGYGIFKYDNHSTTAHRISWSLVHGKIPPDTLVCHKCDNPPCVNPNHLFLCNYQDNHNDMVAKGRERVKITTYGSRQWMSKFKEHEVVKIRRLYGKGGVTQRELASKHKVHLATIQRILSRKNWRHV